MGMVGYSGDGGPAASARLTYPSHVCMDGAGNLYIADTLNQRIRKVDPAGNISTVAGDGTRAWNGDSNLPINTWFMDPFSIAVDSSGTCYLADTNNDRVRKFGATWVATVAGAVFGGGFGGDGGPATAAGLYNPFDVAVDGNIVYIADTYNHRIRRVDAAGNIDTVAGNGTAGYGGDGVNAKTTGLWYPYDVALDAAHNLYIADSYNNRIRKVDAATGVISTVAGTGAKAYNGDGVAATSASLNCPYSVTLDPAGNVYILDTDNYRIRKVDAFSGEISTVCGNGVQGFSPDGTEATDASIGTSRGLYVDAAGNVYFCDTMNQRVRKFPPVADPWARAGQGGLLIAPNCLDISGGVDHVRLRLRGEANGSCEVRIYNQAGELMGSIKVTLSSDGRGQADYSLSGIGGIRPAPGAYWAVANGGGVSGRKQFFITSRRTR